MNSQTGELEYQNIALGDKKLENRKEKLINMEVRRRILVWWALEKEVIERKREKLYLLMQ